MKRLTVALLIGRLDNCDGVNNRTSWQCLIENCGYIWKAAAADVLNKKHGCSKCAGKLQLTNEMVDNRLIGRNIKRLDNYIKGNININWECLIESCGYIWSAAPTNVLNVIKSGCPSCAFGKNEKLTYHTLIENNIVCIRHYDIRKIIVFESRKILPDFYLPHINTIIEYNGDQHYHTVRFNGISQEIAEANFIKQQARDLYLQNFCDTNSIKLIWIDGRTYKNNKLKNYLIEAIISQLK